MGWMVKDVLQELAHKFSQPNISHLQRVAGRFNFFAWSIGSISLELILGNSTICPKFFPTGTARFLLRKHIMSSLNIWYLISKPTTFPHKRKTVSREHRSPYNFQQSQDHNSSKLGRRLQAQWQTAFWYRRLGRQEKKFLPSFIIPLWYLFYRKLERVEPKMKLAKKKSHLIIQQLLS